MKLSEFEGEQALDILADLLEPAAEIMADKEVAEEFRAGKKLQAVRMAIKNHKKAVITILALLDGKDPETYKPKLVEIPMKVLEVLNDPELVNLFQSQGQTTKPYSGSASESIKDAEL